MIDHIYVLLQVNIVISIITLICLFGEIIGFIWMLREIFRLQTIGRQNELGMRAVVESLNKLNERIRSGK